MGKQKSKGQRRLMARKQKRNKAQKTANLRETLFRDFSDMTGVAPWIYNQHEKELDAYLANMRRHERTILLFRKFS